jgi:hypothetical protein
MTRTFDLQLRGRLNKFEVSLGSTGERMGWTGVVQEAALKGNFA